MSTDAEAKRSIYRRNLPPIAIGATLEGVSPQLLRHLENLIRETGWPVMLWGVPGVGKTFAAAVLYASRPTAERVAWFSVRVILRELAAARVDSSNLVTILNQAGEVRRVESGAAIDQITRSDFLVLDDAGTRELSPAQSEILLEILDLRHGKRTVITGNHSIDDLSRVLDGRIVSRLFSGTSIEVSGVDRRTAGRRKFRV